MNLIDNFVNKIDLRLKSGPDLTVAIIDSFSAIAKRRGTMAIIAIMTDDPTSAEILRHCEENGIPSINITVDLSKPENSLLPLDPHPSELAHQRYATMLADFLNDALLFQP